jgi:hypothetical protein
MISLDIFFSIQKFFDEKKKMRGIQKKFRRKICLREIQDIFVDTVQYISYGSLEKVTSIDFEVKLQSAVLCNGREFKKSLI